MNLECTLHLYQRELTRFFQLFKSHNHNELVPEAEMINAIFFFQSLLNGESLRDNYFEIAKSIAAIQRFLMSFL